MVLEGHFVNRPTKESIDRHLEFGSQVPTLLSTMHLYPIDGAAARALQPWRCLCEFSDGGRRVYLTINPRSTINRSIAATPAC
jgi:hypothetical protein